MARYHLYTRAAVCRRGHIISFDAGVPEGADPPDFGYCEDCGARVICTCETCRSPLIGPPAISDDSGNLDALGWTPPSFCSKCGHPFPWVGRDGRIHQLENMLDDEGLAAADELAVREALEALKSPDLADEDAARRWKLVRRLAPGLWEKAGGTQVISSVMTAFVKQQLDLQ